MKVKISLKIFFGYFVLVGLTAWFVMSIVIEEVKPGVRQAMEDSLIDTANVLAELASQDLKSNQIQIGQFAQSFAQYKARENQANIWGFNKQSADYRVYITNQKGIVVFDSSGQAFGQDYSRWNDVYLTLQGKYGARSSPMISGGDSSDTVMYVAAPIKDGGQIIGSLTVAKANRTVLPFIERAQAKIVRWGALLFLLSIALGVLFTWRFTRAIHRLRDYAIAVSQGKKATRPNSSNDELAELAHAMHTMREELDGKQYLQDSIQHLTHELKSPISAIQGAAELISPHMPAADQAHFLGQIKAQSQRLQTIIQNMLGLAALEHQQQLTHLSRINLTQLVDVQISHLMEKAQAHQVQLICEPNHPIEINAEPFLLGQAIYNLLENAIDFSPKNSEIRIQIFSENNHAVVNIKDQGTGIPDYALGKVFDKFYSLPRPATGQKSTGLGLNFVQEVAKLYGGNIMLKNLEHGGTLASLTLAQ